MPQFAAIAKALELHKQMSGRGSALGQVFSGMQGKKQANQAQTGAMRDFQAGAAPQPHDIAQGPYQIKARFPWEEDPNKPLSGGVPGAPPRGDY